MSNQNTALVQRLFAELAAGNLHYYLDSVSDDLCYTVVGPRQAAGTTRGHKRTLGRFFKVIDSITGTPTLTPDTIFGDGDLVAMHAHNRGGDSMWRLLFRFRNGKLSEVIEYLEDARSLQSAAA